MTAALITELEAMARLEAIPSVARFFPGGDPDTRIMGVSVGTIFPVAKRYMDARSRQDRARSAEVVPGETRKPPSPHDCSRGIEGFVEVLKFMRAR
jgi:hypothetical protein